MNFNAWLGKVWDTKGTIRSRRDAKGAMRSRKLKKDRQDNGQWKKDKDLENTNIIQHYVQDRITPIIV